MLDHTAREDGSAIREGCHHCHHFQGALLFADPALRLQADAVVAAEAERDEAVRRQQAAEARADRLQSLHQDATEKLEFAREQSFGGGSEVRSRSRGEFPTVLGVLGAWVTRR